MGDSIPASHELPLHWQQSFIFANPSRFKVVAAGRRWGKTTLMKAALLDSASTRPGRAPENWHVYLAPDLKEARRIMWRPMLDAIPRSLIEKQPNDTRMEIELVTGAIIALWGADDPDSLRGPGLQRLAGDEWADMPGIEDLWEPVILPQLLTTGGDVLIGGTPRGFNHFYELWKRGPDGRAGWASWRYPTCEAPHITPEAYAALVAEYDDPRIMRQELEASFESASGTILGDLWENTHTVQAHDTALLKRGLKIGQRVAWHVVDNPDWLPPAGSKLYGSVDYGFGAPCAIYLHATLPDGHVRTFWELYQRELHDHEQAMRLRLAIEGFRKRKGADGKPLNLPAPDWVVLEPMMYGSRREMGVAKTIAEVYADVLLGTTQLLQGAAGRAVRMSRPQRWRAALMPLPDGLPAWSCTTACPNLIRTVKTVRWDEKDPEVEDDTSENHCIAKGALVTTRTGDKPIETVLAGDEVLTRGGWRVVEHAWGRSDYRQVYRVSTTSGRTLRATANHHIWTENRGFLRVDELADGDILLSDEDVRWKCQQRQKRQWLFPRGFRSGADTVTTSLGGTSVARLGRVLCHAWVDFIAMCGKTCTDRFRRATTSIIATRTAGTIIPTIWSSCQDANISGIMASNHLVRNNSLHAAPISASLVALDWNNQRLNRLPVDSAVGQAMLHLGSLAESTTALLSAHSVMLSDDGIRSAIRSVWWSVLGAVSRLKRVERASDSVGTTRVTTVQPSGYAPVYDLSVRDVHEFLADGILVSNSYESLGRLFEARPLNPRPKPVDPYAKLDEISAAHHRALDKKLNPDGDDIPTLYVPM